MSDYTRAEYAAAREELAKHPPEASGKYVCPLCRGGSSGEVSLALTYRDDGAGFGFFCHRASCGFKGYVGGSFEGRRRAFEPRPYPHPQGLAAAYKERLEACLGLNWQLIALSAGLMGGAPPEGEELVYTLWGPGGRSHGHVSRRDLPEGGRVVRTWRTEDAPAHSLYQPTWFEIDRTPKRELWIVEDHLSAIRLAAYAHVYALALGGVHADAPFVLDCVNLHDVEKVYVALDPDAAGQCLALAARLRNEHGLPAWPILLEDDVKNLDWIGFYKALGRAL